MNYMYIKVFKNDFRGSSVVASVLLRKVAKSPKQFNLLIIIILSMKII